MNGQRPDNDGQVRAKDDEDAALLKSDPLQALMVQRREIDIGYCPICLRGSRFEGADRLRRMSGSC